MKKVMIILLFTGVVLGPSYRMYGIHKRVSEEGLNKSIELLIHKMKRLETKKKESEATSELVTSELVPFYYSLLAAVVPVSIVIAVGVTDIKSVRDVNALVISVIAAGVGGFTLGYLLEKAKNLCFSRCMKNKVREHVAEQYQPKIDGLLDEINEHTASISTDKRNEGMKYLEERLQDSDVAEKLSSIDNIERLQALKERLAYE